MIRIYLILVLLVTNATSQPSYAETNSGFRFEYDNDLLVDSDNKFTSGLSLQWHSGVAETWQDVASPDWLKFGSGLPGLNEPGMYRRVGFAIGQNIQTPNDLEATELIVDDVPYAGALGFETNWISFDNERLTGYALIVGVIGPASGAEGTQRWVHKKIGSPIPKGWDNQLPNELAVNFNGMHKRKVWQFDGDRAFSSDVSLNADFGLGTALTFAEVAAELRVGFNVPYGFTFVPDPIGRSIAYDATVHPSDESVSVYLSFVHRQIYMQHFVFVDGSLWHDTHSVDVDRWQWQTITGLHITSKHWGIHLSFWDSSANVESPLAGEGNDFGTIALEWRF